MLVQLLRSRKLLLQSYFVVPKLFQHLHSNIYIANTCKNYYSLALNTCCRFNESRYILAYIFIKSVKKGWREYIITDGKRLSDNGPGD
jgi:hypothetical protein